MRLTTVILIATLMQVSAASVAQKITMQQKQASLKEIFTQINLQTGYDVVWKSEHLKNTKPITVNFINKEVTAVLDEILPDQSLVYTVEDKTIVISKNQDKSPSGPNKILPIRIKGRVVDEQGQPLVGVTVSIVGTNIGTVTDQNGNYEIDGESDGILIYTFVGFQAMQIKINNQSEINLTLIEFTSELKETEIKGYYNTTKKLNTGNVITVTAEQLQRQPISDPINALQGLVPGLFVRQTSGVAGRKVNTRIRGTNSLANGNDPLFIVDGVQFTSTEFNAGSANTFTAGGTASPFNYLNSADIESITILKDADATAIYGSRGANGVILITTKKAELGKPRLTLNIYTGLAKADQRLQYMNTEEYLNMRRQALKNDNQPVHDYDIDLNGIWDSTKYTDWQDYFIGGSSQITESNLSYSGGTPQLGFRIGGTYREEGTVFPGNFKNKKAAFNFALNHRTADEKFNLSFRGSFIANGNNLPAAGIETRLALAPNAPDVYNPDGTLNWANSTWENPIAAFLTKVDENSKNLIGNLVAGYKILKNLEFKSSFSYNYIDFSQVNATPATAFDPTSTIPIAFRRTRREINSGITTWVVEPQLNFSKAIFNGKLDILIGSTFQSTDRKNEAISGTGYSSDQLLNTLAAASSVTGRVSTPTTYRYNAIYARAGYSYQEKYVLNLTARRDGSSRFGPGRKFGNFGALGLAWVFSEENAIKKNLTFLSFGKLRFSYGVTGNDQIGEYKYLDTYTTTAISYQGVSPLIPKQVTNPNYGWERVDKREIALELGIFENRIMVNTSLYRNRTKNQLVDYGISAVTGFGTVKANIPAVIQNSGIEIDVLSNTFEGKTFEWSTAINLTVPRNKLVSYQNLEASSYATRYIVGQPINSLSSLYTYLGKDETTGMYKFQDYNGDGTITSTQDQKLRFIGQKFYGGLNNHFRYRKFEADILFQFTKQNGLAYYMTGQPGLLNLGYGNEFSNNSASAIRPPLTQANPSIFENTSQFLSSDGQVTDASYLRLKNVSIAYNFRFNKARVSCSIYALGQNLFTVSNYVGFDPEIPSNGIVLPNLKTITFGVRLTL